MLKEPTSLSYKRAVRIYEQKIDQRDKTFDLDKWGDLNIEIAALNLLLVKLAEEENQK